MHRMSSFWKHLIQYMFRKMEYQHKKHDKTCSERKNINIKEHKKACIPCTVNGSHFLVISAAGIGKQIQICSEMLYIYICIYICSEMLYICIYT